VLQHLKHHPRKRSYATAEDVRQLLDEVFPTPSAGAVASNGATAAATMVADLPASERETVVQQAVKPR
jgi:hypothetical protein